MAPLPLRKLKKKSINNDILQIGWKNSILRGVEMGRVDSFIKKNERVLLGDLMKYCLISVNVTS
jgi:hypothetical protein